jgi:ubiquinone/menaquinone biosynthesis C-methylase UbiE
MMSESQRAYLPAAGHDWFLPLYDPLTKLLGVDKARSVLLDQAALRPGYRVLDVGCGTGSLAIAIKRLHPDVDVVGVDPDPKALARARRKAERAAVSIQLDQGFSDALGYRDETFDRVFSSMMFHHLEHSEKQKTLREIRRVLKPGGRLELLDFGGPPSGADGSWVRLLHSHRRLRDNSSAQVLALMAEAGFVEPRDVGHRSLVLGRVVCYQASAPISGGISTA